MSKMFKSISIAFLLLGVVFISSCTEKDPFFRSLDVNTQSPIVMVLKNQASDFSTEVSAQVVKALDYTKIPYLTIDLGIIAREFSIPNSVRSLVITTDRVQELRAEDFEELVEFVSRGNSIVLTGPVSTQNFAFLQGLKPDTEYNVDSLSVGFKLLSDAFPGVNGMTYNPTGLLPHYGLLRKEFKSSVKILASTATDVNQPFVISNKIGLGEVITINSFVLGGKIYRGIIFSSILKGLQGVPYQVANVSTIFLDDFPAPLYNQKLPPIDEEYDVTHAEFVSKIWWPDMQAFADTFNIDYSAMTAFNYNANVVPPFDFQEWRQGSIVYNQNIVQGNIFLANDVKNTRHELAFHGYNHFSLWEQDWDNINFMISSLQAARKRWRVDNLGKLPTNYVPPTNEIDSVGIVAITIGMPSIRYMSSLYFGVQEEGQGREFDPDPYAPSQLFDYPRVTSGFTMNENSLLDQQGMQLVTGIWNHFIHPDDVFQVTQRAEDEFISRNPLGLGWKSSQEYDFGLYHLFRDRIEFTKEHFPKSRFITATQGAKRAEDWRRRLTKYTQSGASLKVNTAFRVNYIPKFQDNTKYWYMYVTADQALETESILSTQGLSHERTEIWDGYLYQFSTENEVFFVPNFEKSYYFDQQFVRNLVRDQVGNYQQYLVVSDGASDAGEEWRDTRLEDAVRAWRMNPKSIANQENLISLSTEFSQVSRAITILENRLLNNENWADSDKERLLTFYGWEGMQTRAELFLEELWAKYASAQVIAFKNQAVVALGLFGDDFERRWRQRELQLNPDDYNTLLTYTKSIESQESWPEMKENLRRLLSMNPETDSLYAFSLQRSFYYESPDSTMDFVEEFPTSSYSQLTLFASNLALMYAFNANNFQQALFWANNTPNFDERLKLYWLGQLNYDQLYIAQAKKMITNSPEDDSLRSFIGANLFYEGFAEESYQVLYPLFERQSTQGLAADTLMRNEIGYLSYDQKKDFYKRYPEFFDEDQEGALQDEYRRNRGVRASVFGEYRSDNFDNTFGRGGVSVEIGNRRKNTHSFKSEYLIFSDNGAQTSTVFNYQGLGYEFTHRSDNQQFQFQAGPTVLFGEGDFIPEAMVSVGYSKDSSFTSVELTGGAELTSTSLQNDYYQSQLQVYRQDYWFDGNITTALSASGKYFTNNVFRYGGQGRISLDLMDSKWKFRPLGEVSYADATKSFISGIPYYTPDQYFAQGVGLDLQYRNPNTFEYRTQLTGEIMGKHERREGFFFSGRLEFQHKFRNFWEFSLGSEISTSQVYRSNRIFFTLSYYFPKRLISGE